MDNAAARAVARDETNWFWFLGTRMTIRVAAADTDGGYGLIEQILPPGFGPPAHIHHAEDEQFYILEGHLTFRCGERTLPAGPGAVVLLPRGVPHSFVVDGSSEARLLQLTSPGGVEAFFAALGTPLAGAAQPPDGPPDIARMVELAARYRIEFVGAP